ncbi:MAG: hypothetical protein JXB07_15980 [Anaerolineae bacterium]|nr:hypothetical protein [Anaerolineae bacterium]
MAACMAVPTAYDPRVLRGDRWETLRVFAYADRVALRGPTAYHSDNLHVNIDRSQPTAPSDGSIRSEHVVSTRHSSLVTRHSSLITAVRLHRPASRGPTAYHSDGLRGNIDRSQPTAPPNTSKPG